LVAGAVHDKFRLPEPLRVAATLRGALGGQLAEHVYSKRFGDSVWPAVRVRWLILLALAAPNNTCFTSAGLSVGWSCKISAAAPATCGAAIEVPVEVASLVSDGLSFASTGHALRICNPGAKRSTHNP
jgi:hypothetical protein